MEDGIEDGAGGLQLVGTEGGTDDESGEVGDIGEPVAEGGGELAGRGLHHHLHSSRNCSATSSSARLSASASSSPPSPSIAN